MRAARGPNAHRRALLRAAAFGAAANVFGSLLPRAALAQSADEALTGRLRRDLERHSSYGEKFSAGPGDGATARWVAERLRASGYRVDEPDFDAPFFVKRAARLTTSSTTVEVVPQAPVVPTSAAGISAPLVVVREDVGDVRGRIVVFVTPSARHAALFADRGIGRTVKRAADAGAVAIVIVTMGPTGEAIALNAPEQPFVPVPTVVLAPRNAEPFVAAASAGASATLVLDGDATHRPSKNVVAKLERGPRWLAISTPRSGWYGCVAERGTGTAAFLELTDWAATRFPELSVFAMNTGGHEYMFAGSHRVLDRAPPPEQTLVWAHIGATLAARDAAERGGELVMLDTADPQRTLMATNAARAAAGQAFRDLGGSLAEPVAVVPQAGELSTFTDLGYEKAFAVLGVHRWFHTKQDTLERVDAGLLAPVVRAHQRAIELLIADSA